MVNTVAAPAAAAAAAKKHTKTKDSNGHLTKASTPQLVFTQSRSRALWCFVGATAQHCWQREFDVHKGQGFKKSKGPEQLSAVNGKRDLYRINPMATNLKLRN